MKNQWSVALGFLALIFLGAIGLASPWSQATGEWGHYGDALFTAFSCVCVTGLSVVDIALEYSRTGIYLVLVLVEIGCLGLMTCGTFLLVAIGRRLSLTREYSLKNAYGVDQVEGLRGLIVWVVGCMVTLETIGAALFYARFRTLFPADAIYHSVFYSIMSFCNAGFSILPGSLAFFRNDPYIVFVSAALTIAGGIGFLVIYNIITCRFMRRSSGGKGRLSLHSRIVLRFTFYLLLAGTLAFLFIEWNGVLRELPFGEKIYTAFYQAVTPRTCGFTIIPTEDVHPLTRLVYMALMFIGGGPGSAAAGLKITTVAVLLYTITAMCRGETETVIDRKLIPMEVVRESIVIFTALVGFAVIITGALYATEAAAIASGKVAIDSLVFEAVSAVTTTGLSVGSTTAGLSSAGRLVIVIAMFIGRLGALSVVMLIGDRESKRQVKFPTEELVVG